MARSSCWCRLALIAAAGLAFAGVAGAAQHEPRALVGVVQPQTGNSDEDSVIGRLEAMMIRKAGQVAYDDVTVLEGGDGADAALDQVREKAEAGFAVDLVLATPEASGAIDAPEARFVYRMPEGHAAAYHFAAFISELGRGTPAAQAQADADRVSRSFSELLEGYADRRLQLDAGIGETSGARYRHTALEDGLIEVFGRLVAPGGAIDPGKVESLSAMVDRLGAPVFQAIEEAFPGPERNQAQVPGVDVRVILGRVIPDFEKYLQDLVNHLDSLEVKQGHGRLLVDAAFEGKGLELQIHDKAKVKTGELYSVDIGPRVHFEISMRKGRITIDRVSGADVRIKLPLIKGRVAPRSLALDTDQEKLTVAASALGGVVKVVGTADVRAKRFTGVDWLATIAKNWPLLLGLLIFV